MHIRCTRALGLLVACALLANRADAQGWSRTVDSGTAWDDLTWAGPAPGGGFVILGSTDVLPNRAGDGVVIRLDAGGDIASARAYGTFDREDVEGATPTSDGGAILVGATTTRFDFRTGFVTRVAPDGSVAWSRTLLAPGAFQVTTAFGATMMDDGAIAVVGSYSEFDFPPRYGFVIVLEPTGVARWQRFFSADSFEQAQAVARSDSGGLLVAGHSAPPGGPGDTDAWVMELTADGDVLWSTTIGTPGGDEATAITAVPGGGAHVAGINRGSTSSGYAPWVLRLAGDGSLVEHRVFGDAEWGDARGILRMPDGSVVLTGRLDIPGSTSIDLWVASLDDTGTRWQRAFDSGQGDWGIATSKAADGGLVLAANSAWGFAEQDHWLLRTDASGQISCRQARDVSVASSSPPVTVLSPLLSTIAVAFTLPDAGWDVLDLPVTLDVPCDACADAGGAPPREPSVPGAGWVPLRVSKHPAPRVTLEDIPEATAYDLHVDRIGSWYAPTAATGTRCRETSWIIDRGGTISMARDLPANSWIVAAASNACGSSSSGRDSFAVERRSIGTWEACPPGP